MLFGGESAGGFGAEYNYHYLLDDLRWVHSTAVPDSALGLDNGMGSGVLLLGSIVLNDIPPLGWAPGPYLAPYCNTNDCAVVPHLELPRVDAYYLKTMWLTRRLFSAPARQYLAFRRVLRAARGRTQTAGMWQNGS